MTGKFMRMKIFIAALVILASAGCASAPANEITNTPESEYVEIEASESNSVPVVSTDSDSVNEKEVISETDLVNDEQQVAEAVDITLDDLTPYQIELFKATSTSFIDNVKDGTMSIDDLIPEHDLIIDTYIMMNELPQNARQLFNEWKEGVGYYEKLTAWIESSSESSESQVQQQAKDAQERVSDTTTDNSEQNIAIGHDGKPATNFHSFEEVTGLTFEDTIIRAIMARYKVSYEEAVARYEADDFE